MVQRKTEEQIKRELDELGKIHLQLEGKARGNYEICEYFVKTKSGNRIDVWALTIEQLSEYIATTKDYSIIEHIKDSQKIQTYSDLLKIKKLKDAKASKMEDNGAIYDEIISKLNGEVLIEKVNAIIQYKKEVDGEELTEDEILKNLCEAKQEKTKSI